ncbi:MAG: hypothetical protein GY713_17740 [Actinomycetia bacterium]|nr:hypothetical protein [Actinomycetes bacterium]
MGQFGGAGQVLGDTGMACAHDHQPVGGVPNKAVDSFLVWAAGPLSGLTAGGDGRGFGPRLRVIGHHHPRPGGGMDAGHADSDDLGVTGPRGRQRHRHQTAQQPVTAGRVTNHRHHTKLFEIDQQLPGGGVTHR